MKASEAKQIVFERELGLDFVFKRIRQLASKGMVRFDLQIDVYNEKDLKWFKELESVLTDLGYGLKLIDQKEDEVFETFIGNARYLRINW